MNCGKVVKNISTVKSSTKGKKLSAFEQELIDTIKKIGFTKLHVFPYSDRTGTKASFMTNKISGNIKKERVKKLKSSTEH